jgi:hypothetical protein
MSKYPNALIYKGGDHKINVFSGLETSLINWTPKTEKKCHKFLGGAAVDMQVKEILNSKKFEAISGVSIENGMNEVNFLTGTDFSSLNIKIEDLLVPLLVYYDPNIKHKIISFSLDPADAKNPKGPTQRKVFYPDEVEGFEVLRGTEFGEIMFEADWLMK